MTVPRLRTRASLALTLLLSACTDASLNLLAQGDGDVSVDASVSPDVVGDDAPAAADVVAPPIDVPPIARPDVVSAPDVVVVARDVPTAQDLPVVAAPDVPRPTADLPTVCESCTAFAPVSFCRGTGSGACLAYAGCREGCGVCAAAAMAGDTCASAPVISAQGRNRTVLTTCGAGDNLNAGCGRNGPDIAFTLRVARTGRVACRLTVPEGVGLVFGYDRLGGRCREDSIGRTCNNATPQRTQGIEITLPPGDYTLYVVTTAPATVVVETELP